MGANAATKLKRVVDNLEKVVGVEWLTACQALHFREYRTSTRIKAKIEDFREVVPFVSEDTCMQPLMLNSRTFIRQQQAV